MAKLIIATVAAKEQTGGFELAPRVALAAADLLRVSQF